MLHLAPRRLLIGGRSVGGSNQMRGAETRVPWRLSLTGAHGSRRDLNHILGDQSGHKTIGHVDDELPFASEVVALTSDRSVNR